MAVAGPQDDAQLTAYRASIDNIDAALVHLLAERFKVTQAVGRYKAEVGLPPSDPAREAKQIARLRALAGPSAAARAGQRGAGAGNSSGTTRSTGAGGRSTRTGRVACAAGILLNAAGIGLPLVTARSGSPSRLKSPTATSMGASPVAKWLAAPKVPPAWHAWLHHIVDAPPTDNYRPASWEKPHVPNLTGTPHAYRPSGSLLESGRRPQATGDYEPWRPE